MFLKSIVKMLKVVIKAMKKAHPYKAPAYGVVKLEDV